MLPYYFLMLLPMLIALIRHKWVVRIHAEPVKDGKNTEIAVFFGIMLLLLMFRGTECGTDTSRYTLLYSVADGQEWGQLLTSGREIGYSLLNKLLRQISSNHLLLFVVTSVMMLVPLAKFYVKEAEIPALTIVLFATIAPFNMYFSGIRQAIAMAMVFPAWKYTKDKKWGFFLLSVLVASLFHKSAFILLLVYPLYHFRITAKRLYFVIPVMLAVYLYNDVIFDFFAQWLWEDYTGTDSTGATTVLLLLIIFMVYAFVIPDEQSMDADLMAMRNMLVLSVVLQCFAPVHALAMRLNYYYLPFIPILIPKIANRCKPCFRSASHISMVVMYVFFLLYFFVRAGGADPLGIYPYVPFWE